jgi:hypothetical protein
LQNAYTNGEQAARSLDEIARNTLFNQQFSFWRSGGFS